MTTKRILRWFWVGIVGCDFPFSDCWWSCWYESLKNVRPPLKRKSPTVALVFRKSRHLKTSFNCLFWGRRRNFVEKDKGSSPFVRRFHFPGKWKPIKQTQNNYIKKNSASVHVLYVHYYSLLTLSFLSLPPKKTNRELWSRRENQEFPLQSTVSSEVKLHEKTSAKEQVWFFSGFE